MRYSQDRSIRVDGIQARYWLEGSQGSPAVLIHGLGGYVENWWPNNLTLAGQHRAYAVDLPGFGRTEKPDDWPYGLPAFVEFIHGFMVALGLERASLVGHSLGGAIALQFTLAYPQMVNRLVLVSSGGLGREMSMMLRLACLPGVGELFTRPSLEGSRSFIKMIIFDPALITEEDVKYDYELARQPGAQQAFLKTLRSVANIFGQKRPLYSPILQKLPTITQPVLALWGREDSIVPVKHAEACRWIPNVRVQIFERCGHIPQFEHPDEFDQEMIKFLG